MNIKTFSIVAFSALLLVSCTEQKEETSLENTQETLIDNQEDLPTEEAVMQDGYNYHGISGITIENVLSVNDMLVSIDSLGSFEGKINATLVGVCKKAGCWVTIENPNGEPIRVMFGNHDFFVPTDTEIGNEVILQGYAQLDTTSVDMQHHFLDDAKEAGEEVNQEDYDAITEPLIEVSFISNAILIKP